MPRRVEFDGKGNLRSDLEMTIEELIRSPLVEGPSPRPEGWDREWRKYLVENLGVLVRQLRAAGIEEIWVGGSFASSTPHPGDIDGYFICDAERLRNGELERALDKQDPLQSWGWRSFDRVPDAATGKRKLRLWHNYHVELFPEIRESPSFSKDLRKARDGGHRGMVRIIFYDSNEDRVSEKPRSPAEAGAAHPRRRARVPRKGMDR